MSRPTEAEVEAERECERLALEVRKVAALETIADRADSIDEWLHYICEALQSD